MAIRKITSAPKSSSRHPGWLYAYYNKPTSNGGECVCIFPPAIADIVQPGFAFDDSCIAYSEDLKASVLNVDFDEPASLDGPSLPPDLEAGWGDPDYPAAGSPVALAGQHGGPPQLPDRAGVRPQALRRRAAAQLDPDLSRVPAPLLKMGMEVARLFLVIDSLLKPAVNDSSRALIAQKLAVSAAIPFYRSVGVQISDDDARDMTAY
jgi:hypothetical protein